MRWDSSMMFLNFTNFLMTAGTKGIACLDLIKGNKTFLFFWTAEEDKREQYSQ